jgi:hypothetical protein
MAAIPRRYTIAALALAVVILAVLAWPAGAAGPWKGQIVDAETGAPLEGVVVLALWDKKTVAWPHPDREFYDVDELVSDRDGRFVIPARDLSKNNPLQAIVGPIVRMFKPGYGAWDFRHEGPRPLIEESDIQIQRNKEGWRRFAAGGAVFELPLLKTREARLRAAPSCQPHLDMPVDRIPRWQAACKEERTRLGR